MTVSRFWYGRVGAPITGFGMAIRQMRERLDRYPQFRSVPIEVAVFPRHREKYERLASIAPLAAADVTPGPDGALAIEFDAPAHSVRLIELRPAGPSVTRR